MLTSRIGRTPRAVEAATLAAASLDKARAFRDRGEWLAAADRVGRARYWWRLARDYARRGL